MDRLRDARRHTDALFDIVLPEFLYHRPIAERHRIIFYIGHLEAFDANLFRPALSALGMPASPLDKLFAFGIDPVDGGLPSDQPSDWPALPEVRAYVQDQRRALDDALSARLAAQDAQLHGLLDVAIEHRLMHAETLAYMFHQLPFDAKRPQPHESFPLLSSRNEMLPIPAGSATLGLARGSAFGWDNEFDVHSVDVPAFRIQKFMVSNAEFLDFVRDSGYARPELWSDPGWQWRESHNIQHPVFWRADADAWLFRGMFREYPLPLAAPVYVSHAEASAYARWSGNSLPTEAQWHRAAYAAPDAERSYPWGDALANVPGNFDFRQWDPAPVDAFPANRSAFGVVGLLGNGWEWTSTLFAPFAGFAAFPFYPGYSADFFDGKHYVIKGGSARTASAFLRRSFRNWFQPHYQYVYAGFRCVEASKGGSGAC